jgi:uncharacterized membrane protein YhaH (DUF805 family)
MQQPSNPYQSPTAPVADQGPEQFSEVRLLSPAGRLGRVRYIGYSVGLTLVFYLVVALGMGISAAMGADLLGGVITIAAIIGMLVVMVILTIQRSHDFNMSGWLTLLVLVPLVNFLFWIVPGTKGSNRFGNPPPPNSTGAVLLALILPLIFVVGILAAIAIPAYQSYAERARMAQEAMQEEAARVQSSADQPSADEPAADQPGADQAGAQPTEEASSESQQ